MSFFTDNLPKFDKEMSIKVMIPKGFKKYCLKCNSHNLTFWQIDLDPERSKLTTEKNILKIKRCNQCNREVSIRL